IKSLGSPASEIPERSPLMSAANTGTPARANPSAITCSETVLPVPVAPVTRPCRLASESVSQAGSSPLPMKIFSAVSAILLSDAVIASPLRAHREVFVVKQRDYTAFYQTIETRQRNGLILRPRRPPRSYFSPIRQKIAERAARWHESHGHSCIAATLRKRCGAIGAPKPTI